VEGIQIKYIVDKINRFHPVGSCAPKPRLKLQVVSYFLKYFLFENILK
jgi:hypothetical protein